jgi:NAD(P)-dependent dehydrogenase (short-subunit alcohol dehydrogenase family)
MRILVTGANRGLGLEFVRQFSARGDRVFAASRGGMPIELQGVTPVRLDVADEVSIELARQAVSEQTDALDLLINNAGIYSTAGGRWTGESFGTLSAEEAVTVLQVNSIGPILIAQRFSDLLSRGVNPKVANISSGYGSVSRNDGHFPYHYSASKAALNQYMRSFARDARPLGIAVLILSPGWVRTDMGGKNATLSAEESVVAMIRIMDRVTLEQTSCWFNYDGQPVAW